MDTPIENPECNGWAIVDANQVDSPSARNYHVIEVNIVNDVYGRIIAVYRNNVNETCCQTLALRPQWRYEAIFRKSELGALRTYLAQMQNGTCETCGNCVKHFYADNV